MQLPSTYFPVLSAETDWMQFNIYQICVQILVLSRDIALSYKVIVRRFGRQLYELE